MNTTKENDYGPRPSEGLRVGEICSGMRGNDRLRAGGEAVNHPAHYNSRADGLECIDVIRYYTFDIGCAIKYLWRAGLKHSAGMTDEEKRDEDIRKAVFYIKDALAARNKTRTMFVCNAQMAFFVNNLIGRTVPDIIKPYPKQIAEVMRSLLTTGLVFNGVSYSHKDWEKRLQDAIDLLEK